MCSFVTEGVKTPNDTSSKIAKNDKNHFVKMIVKATSSKQQFTVFRQII
jgi:hypothetical protein